MCASESGRCQAVGDGQRETVPGEQEERFSGDITHGSHRKGAEGPCGNETPNQADQGTNPSFTFGASVTLSEALSFADLRSLMSRLERMTLCWKDRTS